MGASPSARPSLVVQMPRWDVRIIFLLYCGVFASGRTKNRNKQPQADHRFGNWYQQAAAVRKSRYHPLSADLGKRMNPEIYEPKFGPPRRLARQRGEEPRRGSAPDGAAPRGRAGRGQHEPARSGGAGDANPRASGARATSTRALTIGYVAPPCKPRGWHTTTLSLICLETVASAVLRAVLCVALVSCGSSCTQRSFSPDVHSVRVCTRSFVGPRDRNVRAGRLRRRS